MTAVFVRTVHFTLRAAWADTELAKTGVGRQLLASAFSISPAALSPLSLAPCAVEKKFGEVASPAKNSRPSTGAASPARSPAWPGSAWEYEPRAQGAWAQRHSASGFSFRR